jgi:tripartite-type tricarboxylate transporter receptor subunit TctC
MKHAAWILAATTVALHAHAASAQTWPSKPIRAVIPFAAGSFTDVLPRVVFDHVGRQLKQTIVVENRTGAGGTIGVAAVVRADPDGHTSLPIHPPTPSRPQSIPISPTTPARDLSAVASLGQTPMVMIMSPSKGHKTVQDFVKAAKDKPARSISRRPGVGTATHLAAERFIHAAGIKAVHIPHRGGAEALTDVIAGRVDFYFCPLGTAVSQIQRRPRAGAGGQQPEAGGGAAQRAVDPGSRLRRFRSTRSGSGCSRRPRRRPQSSTACIGKSRTRCNSKP